MTFWKWPHPFCTRVSSRCSKPRMISDFRIIPYPRMIPDTRMLGDHQSSTTWSTVHGAQSRIRNSLKHHLDFRKVYPWLWAIPKLTRLKRLIMLIYKANKGVIKVNKTRKIHLLYNKDYLLKLNKFSSPTFPSGTGIGHPNPFSTRRPKISVKRITQWSRQNQP